MQQHPALHACSTSVRPLSVPPLCADRAEERCRDSTSCRIGATIEMKERLQCFLPQNCCKLLFHPKVLHSASADPIYCTGPALQT